MIQASYTYDQVYPGRYVFTSLGKKCIQKVVQFEPTAQKPIVNMGFGDVSEDSSINDAVTSNNGDMVKVLATVIEILKDYTKHQPESEIFFRGSTIERTKLYARILKTYYNEFTKDFHISAINISDNTMIRTAFDPTQSAEYFAFLIKRF